MKKILINIYVIALLLTLSISASAQYVDGQPFRNVEIVHNGDMIEIKGQINFEHFDLRRQQMAIVTPMLISLNGTDNFSLEPVVLAGKTRYKALNRQIGLDSDVPVPQGAPIIRLKKYYNETYYFSKTVHFSNWMYDAEFVALVSALGCGCEDDGDYISRIVDRVAERPVVVVIEEPAYKVAYVTPPVEEIKQRSETHAAMLNFVVNRYELLRDYRNNAAVLAEVDNIIKELMTNSDLTVTKFTVSGYASPEGDYGRNMVLSQNRALSFVNYLRSQHGFRSQDVETTWHGEDWEGLRSAVVASNLPEKVQILNAIDVDDMEQRKQRVQSMSVYRATLLPEFYPPLRRNEYTVAYVARDFSIEEAKEIVRSRPQYLSLNEMFHVANSYPKGSREFKEVFDVAVRMFPSDPYARTNSAAVDTENGAYDVAIARLNTLNMPEALNNMGVAYAGRKDYTRAVEYFRRAANAGLDVAAENLRNIEKWLLETKR